MTFMCLSIGDKLIAEEAEPGLMLAMGLLILAMALRPGGRAAPRRGALVRF